MTWVEELCESDESICGYEGADDVGYNSVLTARPSLNPNALVHFPLLFPTCNFTESLEKCRRQHHLPHTYYI